MRSVSYEPAHEGISRTRYRLVLIGLAANICIATIALIVGLRGHTDIVPRTQRAQIQFLDELEIKYKKAMSLAQRDPKAAEQLLQATIEKGRSAGLLPLPAPWPSSAEIALFRISQSNGDVSDNARAFESYLRESYPLFPVAGEPQGQQQRASSDNKTRHRIDKDAPPPASSEEKGSH